MNHQLAIIIAVFGKSKFLDVCVQSIADTTKNLPFKIQVIDTEIPRISLATAWNREAKKSNYDTLLFLNDDTLLSEGCLEGLVGVLHSSESYGAVAPTVSACAHTPQQEPYHQCKLHRKGLSLYTQEDVNKVALRINKQYLGQVKGMTFDMSSCCLVTKRSVWEAVGGFFEGDEQYPKGYFPAYGEDNDFLDAMIHTYRLKAIWVKYLYCHHFRAKTAEIVPDLDRHYTDKVWNYRFIARHGMPYKQWRKTTPKNV